MRYEPRLSMSEFGAFAALNALSLIWCVMLPIVQHGRLDHTVEWTVTSLILWSSVGVFAYLVVLARARRKTQLMRHELAVCPRCEYLLDATRESGRCPECGVCYSIESVRRIWRMAYWGESTRCAPLREVARLGRQMMAVFLGLSLVCWTVFGIGWQCAPELSGSRPAIDWPFVLMDSSAAAAWGLAVLEASSWLAFSLFRGSRGFIVGIICNVALVSLWLVMPTQ